MNTGQILALAIGAYFIYEYMYGSGAADGETTDELESGGNGSAAPTPAEISAEIKSRAFAAYPTGKLNFWQWNYYYTQVTGNAGPDPFALERYQGASTQSIENDLMFFEEWKGMQPASAGLGVVWGTNWYAARGRQNATSSQRANVMEGAKKRFIN